MCRRPGEWRPVASVAEFPSAGVGIGSKRKSLYRWLIRSIAGCGRVARAGILTMYLPIYLDVRYIVTLYLDRPLEGPEGRIERTGEGAMFGRHWHHCGPHDCGPRGRRNGFE